MKDENKSIDSWMFRVPYEQVWLLFTIGALLLIAFFLYTLNVYLFVLIFIGSILYIKLQQSQYLGNAIRVHENQYSDIYKTFKNYSKKLGIHRASLYITQDPYLQAYTLGINSCTVVLTSALVEQLDTKELDFVIGHELGHFKAGHTKVSTIFIPIGKDNVFSNLIFGFWSRKTEYSCDRCGLILNKDIDSAITAMIKLSVGGTLFKQLNIQGYVAQIKSAQTSSVKLSELLGDHPLITNRIKNLTIFWRKNFVVR